MQKTLPAPNEIRHVFRGGFFNPGSWKILEKWKAESDKKDTVGKVETAERNVENFVETVNTRSISLCFQHPGGGEQRNARKYGAAFQHFIQHLLKLRKSNKCSL